MKKNKNANLKNRIYLLDTIRGILIIGVVVYHILFDLYDLFDVSACQFIITKYADFIRDFGAGTLIFISGISSRLSRSNIKRGIKAIIFSILLSIVTYFADCFIFFGIIHFMGTAMLIYGLLEKFLIKLDGIVAILVSFILFVICIYVLDNSIYPKEWNDTVYGYVLGFDGGKYMSWDYFPLLRWIFLFITGTYVGKYFKEGRIPGFFYKDFCKPITFLGRYTIWIYLLHQPIVMGILMIIFR